MLNETMDVAASLLNVVLPPPDCDLSEWNVGSTVRVLLDENGSVTGIEPVPREDRVGRRKYDKGDSGVSFPVFNVPPLFRIQPEKLKRTDWDETSLNALRGDGMPTWTEKTNRQVTKSLKVLSEDLATRLKGAPTEHQALVVLCERARRMDSGNLHKQLLTSLIRAVVTDSSANKLWLSCLFVSTEKKNPGKFQIVLEIADWSKYEYPANHTRVWDFVRSRLLASRAQVADSEGTDAFGAPATNVSRKMPKVRMGPMGDVKLRAMSDEARCQTRYGRTGSLSFPVGQNSRDKAERALRWLGAPGQVGKTWLDVSIACGYVKKKDKRKAILLAYPSVAVSTEVTYVGLFAPSKSADAEGVVFQAAAERVVSALRGVVGEHPDAQMRVFVLAKPDGFRTKVLFNAAYDARRIVDAAHEWREGGENVPRIVLPVAGPHRDPLVPFPTEVPVCVNMDWLCKGTRCAPTSGLRIGDGIVLLVETGTRAKQIAEQALRLVVSNATPLLLALGHTDHRNDPEKRKTFEWTKETTKYEKHANLLPSVFGLLLAKLGHMKGEYMHTAPFLIGRMMALADLLHKEYCRKVRAPKEGEGQEDSDKGLPRQLIGNATMAVAMDSPTAGLARLAERIVLYQGWANTVTGKEVDLAKWTLEQYGKVADELGKLALPAQCADADKAQMLLGYLARIEEPTGSNSKDN